MTMTKNCPDCGATVLGGRDGCEALWHEAFYSYRSQHPAAFDAYCMQHLETYCASAKSYAAHLTRLGCGLEYEAAPQVYAAIQKWLNGQKHLEKPAILPFLGAMTIADVHKARSDIERAQVTKAWVDTVWAAYEPQQPLARLWIEEALAMGTNERRQ